MKSKKRMKMRKNKIIIFICSFLGFLIVSILLSKFLDIKGMGPSCWERIREYLFLYIIGAFVVAVRVTIMFGNKDEGAANAAKSKKTD